MKLNLSKKTVNSLRIVLALIFLLLIVLRIQQETRTHGPSVIGNFLQTLGAGK